MSLRRDHLAVVETPKEVREGLLPSPGTDGSPVPFSSLALARIYRSYAPTGLMMSRIQNFGMSWCLLVFSDLESFLEFCTDCPGCMEGGEAKAAELAWAGTFPATAMGVAPPLPRDLVERSFAQAVSQLMEECPVVSSSVHAIFDPRTDGDEFASEIPHDWARRAIPLEGFEIAVEDMALTMYGPDADEALESKAQEEEDEDDEEEIAAVAFSRFCGMHAFRIPGLTLQRRLRLAVSSGSSTMGSDVGRRRLAFESDGLVEEVSRVSEEIRERREEEEAEERRRRVEEAEEEEARMRREESTLAATREASEALDEAAKRVEQAEQLRDEALAACDAAVNRAAQAERAKDEADMARMEAERLREEKNRRIEELQAALEAQTAANNHTAQRLQELEQTQTTYQEHIQSLNATLQETQAKLAAKPKIVAPPPQKPTQTFFVPFLLILALLSFLLLITTGIADSILAPSTTPAFLGAKSKAPWAKCAAESYGDVVDRRNGLPSSPYLGAQCHSALQTLPSIFQPPTRLILSATGVKFNETALQLSVASTAKSAAFSHATTSVHT